MKASLRLRDDAAPLLRAKFPLALLAVPAVASITAGEPSDLSLALATAAPALPSLRLSYAPNHPASPLSVSLVVGSGPGGSPAGSAVTMAAEARADGTVSFSLVLKPSLGDFAVRRRFESGAPAAAAASEVTMRSALPVRGAAAAVRFRWGVRIPAEVSASGSGCEEVAAGVSLRRLPHLVLGKVTVERRTGRTPASGREQEEGTMEKVRRGHKGLTRELQEVPEAAGVAVARSGGRGSPEMAGKGKGKGPEVEQLRKELMGNGG